MYGGLTPERVQQLRKTIVLDQELQQQQLLLQLSPEELQQLEELQQQLQQQQLQKRKYFTLEEDRILQKLVEISGTNINWSVIASIIPGRTTRQCRERFRCYLSPEIKQTPWTKEEDELLRQKQSEFGNKWTQISKFFPGRTDMNIKNRYDRLQRQQSKIPSTNPLKATNDTKQSTDFNLSENLFGADDGFDLAFGQDLFDINLSGADSEFSNLFQEQNSDRGVFGF